MAALFNLFSGGALENCAIFSLGIMPYISASIMLQLLTAVIPQLGRLAREDGGRQKIMQMTRYATVALCMVQGYLLAVSFQHPESYQTMLPGITETVNHLGIPLVADLGITFRIVTVLTLTAGTLFLMWLGDQTAGARDRQRHLADYYHWHCGSLARSSCAGVEDFRPVR